MVETHDALHDVNTYLSQRDTQDVVIGVKPFKTLLGQERIGISIHNGLQYDTPDFSVQYAYDLPHSSIPDITQGLHHQYPDATVITEEYGHTRNTRIYHSDEDGGG